MNEESADSKIIADLSSQIFGKNFPNMLRAANHLRELAAIELNYSFVVKNQESAIVASLRNWPIEICREKEQQWEQAWLLGPILVLPHLRGEGWGRALVAHSIKHLASSTVVTIGDPSYFVPQGFTVLLPSNICVEGEVAPLSVMVKGKHQGITGLRPKGKSL